MFKFSKLRIATAAFALVNNVKIALVSCQPNNFEFPQVSNDDEDSVSFDDVDQTIISRMHLERFLCRRIEEYDKEIERLIDDDDNGQTSFNKPAQSYGFDETLEDEIERLIEDFESGKISKNIFNRKAQSYGLTLMQAAPRRRPYPPAPPPAPSPRLWPRGG